MISYAKLGYVAPIMAIALAGCTSNDPEMMGTWQGEMPSSSFQEIKDSIEATLPEGSSVGIGEVPVTLSLMSSEDYRMSLDVSISVIRPAGAVAFAQMIKYRQTVSGDWYVMNESLRLRVVDTDAVPQNDQTRDLFEDTQAREAFAGNVGETLEWQIESVAPNRMVLSDPVSEVTIEFSRYQSN